jgi:Fe-S cluster assembly ATP-binding protein
LAVEGLVAGAGTTTILRGVDLLIGAGELHALMGPNGSGKSTLTHVLTGDPTYRVTAGRVLLRGEEVTDLAPDVRAKKGMFLAFQHPEEIAGVPISQFLRQGVAARRGSDVSVLEIRVQLREWCERLGMDPAFAERHLNDGLSGGEKKRNEILQLALLQPDVAILDEIDSGLDIDGLRHVAAALGSLRGERPELGLLVVTHYEAILQALVPDVVHVFVDGRIVESGGRELAETVENSGYERWRT